MLQLLVVEEKRIARARLMRGGGDDFPVLLLVVVVEERGVQTVLQIEGGCWSRHVYGWEGQRSLVERCSEVASAKLPVGAVAGCCTHRLNSHTVPFRRCGRAPAAPPLK